MPRETVLCWDQALGMPEQMIFKWLCEIFSWTSTQGKKEWNQRKSLRGGIHAIRDAFPVLLPLLFQVFHEQMVASSFKEPASGNLVCIPVGTQGKGSAQCWNSANAPGVLQTRALGWAWIIPVYTDTSPCTEGSTPKCS